VSASSSKKQLPAAGAEAFAIPGLLTGGYAIARRIIASRKEAKLLSEVA
jgi:hypothetical protein